MSFFRGEYCGVKELIMFIARANAAITQTMYQMIYPSEPNSERFNLFLCHVFAMYQRCSISASFEWFRFPNEWFSIFFYLWARELKLVSFLPNFDVIRTKEAEMEPVYKTCFGRGIT